MIRIAQSALLVVIALAASTVVASNNEAGDPAFRADTLLKNLVETSGIPSISTAIFLKGKPVYSNAFGLASIQHQVPATPRTVYPIGSVTKTITATAALMLVEQGKLNLQSPITEYCPAFPGKSSPVLVQHLLANTGGIRHYDYQRFQEDFLNTKHFDAIDQAIQKFADDPLVSEPGSKYHYSSWGYVLVGCAIEGAIGKPYIEYIASEILEPNGMSATQLDRVEDIIPNRAQGYSLNDAKELKDADLFDSSDRYPAGGLVSTPSDLTRFANALLNDELLKEGSRQAMWSPASLSSGEDTGHGLGWDLAENGAEVFQGGTTVGATSFLYVRPEQQLVVAFSVNLSLWQANRLELARTLADVFIPTE